jgi:hypothetical protein
MTEHRPAEQPDEDDPVTAREELELHLMDEGQSEDGEHIDGATDEHAKRQADEGSE